MKLKRIIPVALAMLFVLALVGIAEACPGCAEAQAGQGANRGNIVRGYFWSICFMMSMPFLLVGGFGTYCYVQFKKLKAKAAAEQAGSIAASQPLSMADLHISQKSALTAAP
jgi:heme/copper-type cytochrome/quinol oxidase subunit 2